MKYLIFGGNIELIDMTRNALLKDESICTFISVYSLEIIIS